LCIGWYGLSAAKPSEEANALGSVARRLGVASEISQSHGLFVTRWLALALALTPSSVGAAPAPRFARFSVEHGLSQSTVQAIVQDRTGFLWFGTEEGLNRFDGYSFVVFRRDARDPRSLHDDRISALHEDQQRRLWVGTWSGLSLFDRRSETFSRIADVRGIVTAILEDRDGTLWFGTSAGLFRRDAGTGAVVHHRHDAQDPGSLGGQVVSALLRDRRGRLWVGTRDAGLDRLEVMPGGRVRFQHHRRDAQDPRSLAHDEVWGVAEDAAGNLWVATYGGGLTVLDEATGSFRHYRHRLDRASPLGSDLLTTVFVDRAGTVWVGTDGAGVQRYDPAADRFVAILHDAADPGSLSQNVVRTLFEDVQGQLWVGTYLGGASLLKRPRRDFAYFAPNLSDPTSLSDTASSFLEDERGRIWVGTGQGLVNRFDRGTGSFVRHRFPEALLPKGAAVLAMSQDQRGRIWLGTFRGGLAQFDPERGALVQVHRHRPGDARSPSHDEVWALAPGDDGALWLGTNRGLDRFDPDGGGVTAHYETTKLGLLRSGVRALLRDRPGNLWIGSLDGLHLLRRGSSELVHYRHDEQRPDSLSHDAVVSLHEDRHGRLWVGTFGGGLNRLDVGTGTFVRFVDLPSNVIFGIQEDRFGKLWVSTNHGLSRLDPETGSVDNFDLTNGLQSLQFRFGDRRLSDGHLVFPSVEGFYDFDPGHIQADTFAPTVVLTSMRVFNEPRRLPAALAVLDQVTLSHQDKVFSLEFAALDYAFPRRNQYAYRMEGFSDQWISLGARREVTFTNLDPGTYAFRVKASNGDGAWYEASTAALRVNVTPPLWKQPWFRALAGAVVALGLLGAHRVRVRHVTKDLEEHRQAEQALRRAAEAEMALRAGNEKAAAEWVRTFDSMQTPVLIVDARGRVARLNRAARDLAGSASDGEMVGRSVAEVGPGEPWQKAGEVASQVTKTHAARACQVQDGASGKTWDLIANPSPNASGDPERVIVVARDVTSMVDLQESLRRSETMSAMGSLLAAVAHEVRNPLFGISANLDAFEAKAGVETASRPFLTVMRGEVNRLTVLMQDLLDYGRPAQSALTPGAIDDVVAEAVASCASLARSRDVASVSEVPPDLPPVLMDRKRLVQVFQNLLQNAIQLSDAGSRVTVEGWSEDRVLGPTVVLKVSDSGPGFVPDDLPRAFEPFFSRRRGGTGLGLAIVQRIVEAHGGTVTVENRPGGGAMLSVRLPSAQRG
jgi:PAS domain S-box-containing protein